MSMRASLALKRKSQPLQGDKLLPPTGPSEVSHRLCGQNGIFYKVEPNRPIQAIVAAIEPAAHKISDHDDQFLQIFSLGCHFGLVTDRHKHVAVLFNLENQFLHGDNLGSCTELDKVLWNRTKRRKGVDGSPSTP
jgi:hypothetical protein